MRRLLLALLPLTLVTVACGDGSTTSDTGDGAGGSGGAALGCDPSAPPTRTISCVESFTPGEGAGFGQESFPDIVYGDPVGAGTSQGSTDVLSLGKGGEIVVGFGGNAIVDEDGADFILFENAFFAAGNASHPFVDLAEVSVSEDGTSWATFPCAKDAYPYTGCAGWHPVFANDQDGVSPFDPATAGGDAFDLADVGVTKARLVRIRDLGTIAAAPTAGFDLDAAAIVHPAIAGD